MDINETVRRRLQRRCQFEFEGLISSSSAGNNCLSLKPTLSSRLNRGNCSFNSSVNSQVASAGERPSQWTRTWVTALFFHFAVHLSNMIQILLISNYYNFKNQIWRLKKYMSFFFKIMDWFVWLGGKFMFFFYYYYGPSIFFFNLIPLHWLYLRFDLVVFFGCLNTGIL